MERLVGNAVAGGPDDLKVDPEPRMRRHELIGDELALRPGKKRASGAEAEDLIRVDSGHSSAKCLYVHAGGKHQHRLGLVEPFDSQGIPGCAIACPGMSEQLHSLRRLTLPGRSRTTRMSEQVFVTGGSGFVGSAVIEELVARGCGVNALVNRGGLK